MYFFRMLACISQVPASWPDRAWPGIYWRSPLIVFSRAPQLNNKISCSSGFWRLGPLLQPLLGFFSFSHFFLSFEATSLLLHIPPPSLSLSAHRHYTPSSVWQTSSYIFAPWPHPQGLVHPLHSFTLTCRVCTDVVLEVHIHQIQEWHLSIQKIPFYCYFSI